MRDRKFPRAKRDQGHRLHLLTKLIPLLSASIALLGLLVTGLQWRQEQTAKRFGDAVRMATSERPADRHASVFLLREFISGSKTQQSATLSIYVELLDDSNQNVRIAVCTVLDEINKWEVSPSALTAALVPLGVDKVADSKQTLLALLVYLDLADLIDEGSKDSREIREAIQKAPELNIESYISGSRDKSNAILRMLELGARPRSLSGVDFSLMHLGQNRLDFSNITFVNCSFLKADLAGISCKGTNFVDCILEGATFDGCDLSDSLIQGSSTEALLVHTIYPGIELPTFKQSKLRNAELRLILASPVSFVDFSGSDLKGAKFTDCALLIQSEDRPIDLIIKKKQLEKLERAKTNSPDDFSALDADDEELIAQIELAETNVKSGSFKNTNWNDILELPFGLTPTSEPASVSPRTGVRRKIKTPTELTRWKLKTLDELDERAVEAKSLKERLLHALSQKELSPEQPVGEIGFPTPKARY